MTRLRVARARRRLARWRLVLEAVPLLVVVRVGLRLFPLPKLRRWLARSLSHAPDPRARPCPDQIVWAVDTASRAVPFTKTCLVRALAIQTLLERAGVPASLRIGVAHAGDGRVQAHAWVECDGVVVTGDSGLDRFEVVSGLDGA